MQAVPPRYCPLFTVASVILACGQNLCMTDSRWPRKIWTYTIKLWHFGLTVKFEFGNNFKCRTQRQSWNKNIQILLINLHMSKWDSQPWGLSRTVKKICTKQSVTFSIFIFASSPLSSSSSSNFLLSLPVGCSYHSLTPPPPFGGTYVTCIYDWEPLNQYLSIKNACTSEMLQCCPTV